MNGRASYSFDLESLQKSFKSHLKPIQTRSKSNLNSSNHVKFHHLIKLPIEPQGLKRTNPTKLEVSTRFSSVKPQEKSGRRLSIPKSLNFSCRQQEAKKIFNENSRIFKRLSEISPIISLKRQRADYQKSLGYKRTISRASFSKNLKKLSFFCIKSKFLFKFKGKSENFSSIDSRPLKFPVLENTKKLEKKKSETSLLPMLKNDSICQSSLNLSSLMLSTLD